VKLTERIEAFLHLRDAIQKELDKVENGLFIRARNENSWFIPDSSRSSFEGLIKILEPKKLESWLSKYPISDLNSDLEVGLMMAGNIPAVGFHDLMCVVLSGNKASVKMSNSDSVLMSWIISQLRENGLTDRISVESFLKGKDAYIATGSDNSSRYFDYYFGKYPNIIRKNRTSVAVITSDQSDVELQELGKDIFTYFGLGCRNVSKLFVHKDFNLIKLLDSLEPFQHVADHHKYFNNYEYNKSIFLVNRTPHHDSGFLLLKEDEQIVSPIATLYYEYYNDEPELRSKLESNADKIQCIVGKAQDMVGFGKAQYPSVEDYADGVDTMSFLTQLK